MTAAESTAQLVALYARIGMAERPRKIPREQPPILIESAYATQLVSIVDEWRAELEPLLADLPRMLERVRRLDDTAEGSAVRSTIQRARTVAARTTRVTEASRRAAREAAEHQKRQFGRQMKSGLGVEVPTQDRKVPTMVERFVERNVSKMEALSNATMSDVEDMILRAFERGATADDLAKEISERFGVAERQARLLASNQLTKLTAQVRRERHLEVGVATFRWRTRNDLNVRPSHAVKHDRVFPYEGSRAPSFFPGEERHCRCEAVPVIDDIKSKSNELAGKGKNRRRTDARLDSKETMMRIAIAGGPRCGKTTLAATLGEARHTDDLIERGWSEASAAAATWFDEPGPWIIEGVAIPRALRKWLAANPSGKPCDVVHWMNMPHVPLTTAQATMQKGCVKVWNEIVGELRNRGVDIR